MPVDRDADPVTRVAVRLWLWFGELLAVWNILLRSPAFFRANNPAFPVAYERG